MGAVPLPHIVARLNKRYTNRLIEPIVRRTRRFALAHHVGRHSGQRYMTPLYAFDHQGSLLIALTYGPGADWVRNLSAGGGTIECEGTEFAVCSVAIVDRGQAWPYLPRPVRLWLRILRVSDFLLIEVQ